MVSGIAFVIGMGTFGFLVGMGLETLGDSLKEIEETKLKVLYPRQYQNYKDKSLWGKIKKRLSNL